MILTVHDELLFEAPEDETPTRWPALVREIMEAGLPARGAADRGRRASGGTGRRPNRSR